MITTTDPINEIIIDKKFQNLIPALSNDEFKQLSENIIADGCRDPLVVWKEQNILLDGHNRYRICVDNGIQFQTKEISFPTRENAFNWMIDNQLGRRNMTPEQASYLRGKQYRGEKKSVGGNGSNQHTSYVDIVSTKLKGEGISESRRTIEKMADKHNVTPKTIQRDAKYADAVDTLERLKPEKPEIKHEILSRETRVTRKDAIEIAKIEKKEPEKAKVIFDQVVSGESKNVAAAKKTEKVKAVPINVEAKQQGQIEIEEIAPGIFVVKNKTPNYKSYFNKTNDNIEWSCYSWNPVTGCLHPCSYCYARDRACNGFYKKGFPTKFAPTFHPGRLTAPQNTRIPENRKDDPGTKNVFVCSMADLFGEWVPQEWIDQVLESCRQAPQWNFLFLTKNPKRYIGIDWPKNAWVGATADTQERYNSAINAFGQIEANGTRPSVLFLSCEPLLERIDPGGAEGHLPLDWIIIGALKNSENSDRQPQWEWVDELMLAGRKAGCKIYCKPNLTVRPKEFPV